MARKPYTRPKCASCTYLKRGYCSVRATTISNPHREHDCRAYKEKHT